VPALTLPIVLAATGLTADLGVGLAADDTFFAEDVWGFAVFFIAFAMESTMSYSLGVSLLHLKPEPATPVIHLRRLDASPGSFIAIHCYHPATSRVPAMVTELFSERRIRRTNYGKALNRKPFSIP
jgi:hypothetical protein